MPKPPAAARLDLLDAIQGHYASEIMLGLARCGALQLLAAGAGVDAIARSLRLDEKLFAAILDFVARSTTFLERDGDGQFRLKDYSAAEISFQIQKFIGAYGGSVRGLPESLRRPVARGRVDEDMLTAAFGAAIHASSRIAKRLTRAGYRRLLDLGCGPASLLVQMALANREFRGIGVDRSRAMCRLARDHAREAGVASRVEIYHADVRHLGHVLSGRDRAQVDVLHARSVLNAFFGDEPDAATTFLRKLRSAFPGRVVFFVDYCGELGRPSASGRSFRLGQLQDVAQLASGQGIPPSTRAQWHSLYRAAGCQLISTHQARSNDIRWFTHEVRLASSTASFRSGRLRRPAPRTSSSGKLESG